MNYIKGFDSVRAFAVLFVIISHWGPFFKPGTTANKIMTEVIPSGQFGVTLFFVLSGFLITAILLKERAKREMDGGKNTTIIKSFFIRRSLRIFPIYYLALMALLLAGDPYLAQKAGYYFFYLGNLPPYMENNVNPLIHLWSLAVEEQFYLVWPWVILFAKDRHLKPLFIGCIVVGILSKYFVLFVQHRSFTTLVINWFDAFGIGGLYAFLCLHEPRKATFDKRFLPLFALLLYIGWRVASIGGLPVVMMLNRVLDVVVSVGVIVFVLNNKSRWMQKHVLENKVLNYIGKISYGLYLYHYIIDGYVESFVASWLRGNPGLPRVFHSFGFEYAAKFAVLFAVCILSYNLIELPLLRLKKYFQYSQEKKSDQEGQTIQPEKAIQAEEVV